MSGEAVASALEAVEAFLARFVAFPTEHARVATALWVGHTYLIDEFDSTPRLAFLSPEPGSGKTRALEVIESLVRRPMHAVNATPAALFRSCSDPENRPTILFDEVDTVFGPRARDNEDLRGFLNAGHRRSGVTFRCEGMGTAQRVVAFPSFGAVALAGLHYLPGTIGTRSVVVRMRRRGPDELVSPYRLRVHEPTGLALGEVAHGDSSRAASAARIRTLGSPSGSSASRKTQRISPGTGHWATCGCSRTSLTLPCPLVRAIWSSHDPSHVPRGLAFGVFPEGPRPAKSCDERAISSCHSSHETGVWDTPCA